VFEKQKPMQVNPLNPTNLCPDQIAAAFDMCERPVKRLLRDYFVQFDREFIRKGKGPVVMEDGKPRPLLVSEIPKEYSDQAGLLKMIHGDSSKNLVDTEMFTPDSLLKIPSGTGHLTIPQKKNEDGTTALWSIDIHLRKPTAKFDYDMLNAFAKEAPDPEAAAKMARELISAFVPSSIFIFNLLKSKNQVMETLRLNCSNDAIYIEDARCDIVPNRVLIVRIAKDQDMMIDTE